MDSYTENRIKRFSDELENMTDNMTNMEYYGSAEGVVFATVNGKKELLRVEIDPKELYPENAERLQKLIVAAIAEAVEDATITEEHYSWAFISEDLCLGC